MGEETGINGFVRPKQEGGLEKKLVRSSGGGKETRGEGLRGDETTMPPHNMQKSKAGKGGARSR